jgi:hypothetical protein
MYNVDYRYEVKASDIDGDVLEYSLMTKPAGMSIDAVTGIISWKPALSQVGLTKVVVNVSDGSLFAIQSFDITVTGPASHKPFIETILGQNVTVGELFSYQVIASDEDAGDVLSYTLEGNPSGMQISSTGLITWTPTQNDTGTRTIVVKVSDGKNTTIGTMDIKVLEKEKGTKSDVGLPSMLLLGLVLSVILLIIVFVVIAMLRRQEPVEPVRLPVRAEYKKTAPARYEARSARAPPAHSPAHIKQTFEARTAKPNVSEPEMKTKEEKEVALEGEIDLEELEDD